MAGRRDLTIQEKAWAEALCKLGSVEEVGAWLPDERLLLMDRIAEGFDGLEWCEWHSALMDCVVKQLFEMAVTKARQEMPGHTDVEPEIAVVATGGYGRRELSPYSDLDLTFIPYQDGDPFLDAIVRHMFRSVMDVIMTRAGVEVGYAYRLMDDCAQLDSKTRTGLVDMRLIAGSRSQYARFDQSFWAVFNPTDFIFEKVSEYEARHLKFGNTPHLAEPNLKEIAGGIRDFHVARWMAQVRYNSPIYQIWQVLCDNGAISDEESKRLGEAFEFLTRVRNHLHCLAGEQRDILARTRQEIIAEKLGYQAKSGYSPAEPLMHDLYQQMYDLFRLCRHIVRYIAESKLFLSIGLDCEHGEIAPANKSLERESPLWTVWACRIAQQYNIKLSLATQVLIEEVISETPQMPNWGEAGRLMMEILSQRGKVAETLRLMADLGVLGWIVPDFNAIHHLIPYDSSHEFSVGEHTLRAIAYLDELMEDEAQEQTDLRHSLQSLVRPEALYLAMLYHDAGKGDPIRPHPEVGAELVGKVADLWGWDSKAKEDALWLVQNHLVMAQTARQRDLTLDHTIRDFTKVVDDPERLQMLYLLTYADTKGVAARIWTPLQAHFVGELYMRALRALKSEDDVPDIGGFRRRLMRELNPENTDESIVAEHIQNMPPNYLLNTPREQMALHIAYVEKAKKGEPVIDFYHPPASAHTELTIVTPDDPEPGLLSKITGCLYAADLDVHAAYVFTRQGESPIALDTIWVDFRGRQLSSAKCNEVKGFLEKVLTGKTTVAQLVRKRGKDPDTLQTAFKVKVQAGATDVHALVDVQTPVDRGVLYRISHALSSIGWNIHSARLGLWAGRAITSFYVTDANDGIISPEETEQINALLPPAEKQASPFG